jgi:putative endonuclease
MGMSHDFELAIREGATLVICEVKTRSSAVFGTPAEAVTRAKQAKLRLLARHYLERAPFRPSTIRFDVAAVLAGQIEIIEAAF